MYKNGVKNRSRRPGMKRHKSKRVHKHESQGIKPTRSIIRMEGKFLHGTRGKETRGARGNKKY